MNTFAQFHVATDLVFRSLFKGDNLYDLVNRPDPDSLAINSESSIQQILIVDAEDKIFDSTDENDIRTLYKPDNKDLPIGIGNLKNDLDRNRRQAKYNVSASP